MIDVDDLVGPTDHCAVVMDTIWTADEYNLPPVTTAQLARKVGMTWQGMYLLLCRIERLPLHRPLRKLRYGWTFRQCGVDRWE